MTKHDYEEFVRTAADMINKRNAQVYVMLFKINDQYTGFKPNIKIRRKKGKIPSKERDEELMGVLNEAHEFLKSKGITLLFCFTYLNEGGAIIHLTEEGVLEQEKFLDMSKKTGLKKHLIA